MIGLYDFTEALSRYKNGNLRTDDAYILWAAISTASNSGADISRDNYAIALEQTRSELYDQLGDGHDVDDMINWTSQQDWCRVGIEKFEEWLNK